jgi:glycosyltransferase involved in cell wall biosynthesis
MTEKKKILVISDHPMAPSGVGTQTKYIIETLLNTGRYKFVCLGGAVKHRDYNPQKIQGWEDDWIVYPVKGYGTQEMVRSALFNEKPDMIWFMTDPRFYGWLWMIENEIRKHVPMVYYHVWDNYPYPKFNDKFYESTDVIASISRVTHDIVNTVSPETENHYIPHAVDTSVFFPYSQEDITKLRQQHFDGDENNRVTFFWNNRNARRKMSGSLIHWFNEFAEKVGPENVRLIMHTDPKDPNGQDLEAILRSLDALDGRIILSTNKIAPQALAAMYNMSDCTINISDAEGFGLATLESLSCQVPIIVNMTGGLQEQVTDGKDWFGIGITPSSKAIIGSQQVPYIYEDRISKEDFIDALTKIYSMSPEERRFLGIKGHQHVVKNYNFEKFKKQWIELIDSVVENHGSWETRKGYKSWEFTEIKK